MPKALPGRPWARTLFSISTMPRICARNHGSILQALKMSSSVQPSRIACATCSRRSGVGVPSAARIAFLSSPLAKALDIDFVEAGEAGLQPAQRLLQAFLEGAADRHDFADRFHRGGQRGRGAGEFLEGEARNFGDDIVDAGLEDAGVAPPVMSLANSSSV